jgi:carbonic anhydrase
MITRGIYAAITMLALALLTAGFAGAEVSAGPAAEAGVEWQAQKRARIAPPAPAKDPDSGIRGSDTLKPPPETVPAPADGETAPGTGDRGWDYSGDTGPEHWGSLDPAYHLCSDGSSQSPIDFVYASSTAYVPSRHPPGYRRVRPRPIEFSYRPTPARVINDAHVLQVPYQPGSFIRIEGRKYELVRLDFHFPSEHRIRGMPYPMEVQLVHQGPFGEMGIVGIFALPGRPNRSMQVISDFLPSTKGEERRGDGVWINAADFLPRRKSYYHYEGSLTTPPCTEGVQWYVLKNPVEVSAAQIARTRALYPYNARPVQTGGQGPVVESRRF